MRTTLVVISLLALFIHVTSGSRRLMKPDPSFGDDLLINDGPWKVIAVYSQNNLDFFKQVKCLTLSYTDIFKPGYKPQKTYSSSSYYYDSSSNQDSDSEEDDSDLDSTQKYLGFKQNMSWFNMSTGSYEFNFTTLDYGRWSKDDSQSGVFLEDDVKNSDDEWIVSFSNGNFNLLGRKDATEIYLMVYDIEFLSDSDEEYPINEAYHAFNASLLDNINVIYNTTFTPDCEVRSTPLTNFSLTSFAQKPWYAQLLYQPLFADDPASQEICYKMAVNNITDVNGLTVVQFNFSNYVPVQNGTHIAHEWTTLQYDYYQDPTLSSVFRPMVQGNPVDWLVNPNMAMVFYWQQAPNTYFWGFQNTAFGWIITDTDELEDSGLLSDDLTNILSDLDWEQPYGDFFAGSCNYNLH